ncbi:hypothetical protein [Geotalea uraniireducens]|uniref:hypothetical protein n=1 Tax=Geotalea uraniireducens TaxID=351604 RepID=UPI0012ECDC58|nr:hypothetical protein [Geotalea uraniireducens]
MVGGRQSVVCLPSTIDHRPPTGFQYLQPSKRAVAGRWSAVGGLSAIDRRPPTGFSISATIEKGGSWSVVGSRWFVCHRPSTADRRPI